MGCFLGECWCFRVLVFLWCWFWGAGGFLGCWFFGVMVFWDDGVPCPLAGCPLLTTTGLSGLVQLQELEELELTNCPGATPELFKYFSQHLPCCMVIE